MIDDVVLASARAKAADMLSQAGIILTDHERTSIEVSDLGLGNLDETGLQVVTYVNNERYCAKELVMFPRQTCPQHRHPPVDRDPGKLETFRCRFGTVWLYVEGEPSTRMHARIPSSKERFYTARHEIVLRPGDEYTIAPGVLHWFQAGDEGAIVSEFSSTSRDELDAFTDPSIKRLP